MYLYMGSKKYFLQLRVYFLLLSMYVGTEDTSRVCWSLGNPIYLSVNGDLFILCCVEVYINLVWSSVILSKF